MRPALEKRVCLVIMLKYPDPGRVKTRLARDVGPETAARLYRCFVRDLLKVCRNLNWPMVLSCHPARPVRAYQDWLGNEYTFIVQAGDDLGGNMQDAFEQVFALGYSSVILTGSDMPHLPQACLETALAGLDQNGCVIGPTRDGGYYLLGMCRDTFQAAIFGNLPWSSRRVFGITMQILARRRVRVFVLKTLRDIDTLADLQILLAEQAYVLAEDI